MPTGALIVLALLIGIAVGLLLGVALYALELRRLSHNLRERDAASNARLSLNARPTELPALVDAINAELDRSAQTRVAAIRSQQEFQRDLSALSHDIRTPLAGAKGYLQLACEETDSHLREQRLEAAIERIDRTSELLDALFSYTKASDPDLALDMRPLDIREVVERCLIGHYPEFEALGWEPRVEGAETAATIDADREALGRIIENLVVNALRHGSGAPTIRLGCSHDPGTVLAISNLVEDPQAIDSAQLFDRFYRADAARQGQGSGLGLATAAKLARAMALDLQAHIEDQTLTIEIVTRR